MTHTIETTDRESLVFFADLVAALQSARRIAARTGARLRVRRSDGVLMATVLPPAHAASLIDAAQRSRWDMGGWKNARVG